jgi:SAM-dependent methyltransferase
VTDAEADRPGNYAEQARTYDLTRGASPTIVARLAAQLGEPAGRNLADLAGGTGNYAEALSEYGFRVTIADASFEMLARSVPKIGSGRQVNADVMALPFPDDTFDTAMCVIAAHLFADRAAAFREANRVLRDGPYVLVAYARENREALFVQDYFGGWWPDEWWTVDEIVEELRAAGFSHVQSEPFVYQDTVGGSLVAMHRNPEMLADRQALANTSYWHRLSEDVREAGLRQLQEDLRSGVLEQKVQASLEVAERVGHGTIWTARP